MYKNSKIIVGKNEEKEMVIIPKMANRHGLITGASGTGKTVTLKVLAESFSNAGVPVFMVDVKGDLSGTCKVGVENDNLKSRVEKLGLEDFTYKKFPVTFFDVFGKNGHPIRTTVTSIGHRLLSKMLGLSDVQDGVLAIIYKIAKDEGKSLDDLEDLDSMLKSVGNKRVEYSNKYGNIQAQSLTTIQRNVLELIEDGADIFFGKPSFDIKDFIRFDNETGYGYINILDAQDLFKSPTSYVIMILWLLNSLYDNMPEVGDLEKPKLVFFFDEAHLIFKEMPKVVVDHIIQVVKLIRSKGVGLYFISQTPSDIPDEILGQLGNRVQHGLRCYTKTDEKVVKAAADSYRDNPKFNTFDAIKSLKTGEALVSFLDEDGSPEVVEKVTILPPQSMMGIISDEDRKNVIVNSNLYMKYEEKINDRSAYEINEEENRVLLEKKKMEEEAKLIKEKEKEEEKLRKEEDKKLKEQERERAKLEREKEKARKNNPAYKLGKKVVNKTADKMINKGLNALLKGLFK